MRLVVTACSQKTTPQLTTKPLSLQTTFLTHWGRVMHICVSNLAIIGSDNGLSPGRCQAIVWTNAGILLIGPLETNFSEILNVIYIFPFKKISSGKWRPFCLGHNVLTHCGCNLKWIIFKIISQIDIVPVKLTSGESHTFSLMINQYSFR